MPYSLSRFAMWTIVAMLPLIFLPQLPEARYDGWIILGALGLLRLCRCWAKDLAILMLLFLWAVMAGRTLLDQVDLLSQGTPDALIKIESVLNQSERLKIKLLKVNGKEIFPPVQALINVKQNKSHFCRAQKWSAKLKLRPVHARLNEGGFDAQRFALANSTPLTGRVLSLEPVEAGCGWRDRIIQRSEAAYSDLPWQSIISALAFGERGEVSQQMTRLLRETGTAHLMAISGMHISLAASVGWLIARALQLTFRAHWIGYRFPLFLSLMVALTYTWLSGGNPPSIRAMLALSTWSAIRLAGVRCDNWQVWGICIGIILFFDPLSILSDSLWLSAMAVAGLLFWFQWFPLPARFAAKKSWLLLHLLHLQLGLFMLLMPVQMLIFHGISFSALLANVWAVPLVTLLTVPLILCALALTPFPLLSYPVWWLADRTLELVFVPLGWLPSGWLPLNKQALLISALIWLSLIACRFHWWRTSPVTLLGCCLSLGCWRLNTPRPDWRIDMLDIGHGLAVVISKQGEAVVYDTGNRWPAGDAALSQILPWLSWQGIQVKEIILSHGHLDHIGGFASLSAAFPDAVVHSGLGTENHLPCEMGQSWGWRGLLFQVLWPSSGQSQSGNNQSCVVRVSDGKWRVLLTGDIESQAELEMVRLYGTALQADLLQVPHHGSNTSSVPPFLRAVKGQVALASAARYSAWKLPAEKVLRRYQEYHYSWYDTAVYGQVSAAFYQKNWQVKGLRAQIMSRWYHQWFGVPRYSR